MQDIKHNMSPARFCAIKNPVFSRLKNKFDLSLTTHLFVLLLFLNHPNSTKDLLILNLSERYFEYIDK